MTLTTRIPVSSTPLFARASNTALIIADPTYGSGSRADHLQDVMGADWDWPSRDELLAFYTNLHLNGLGGFTNSIYWSSSEGPFSSNAYAVHFTTGNVVTENKFENNRVRAVKAF